MIRTLLTVSSPTNPSNPFKLFRSAPHCASSLRSPFHPKNIYAALIEGIGKHLTSSSTIVRVEDWCSLLQPAMLIPFVTFVRLKKRWGLEKSASGLSRMESPPGMLEISGSAGVARPLKVTWINQAKACLISSLQRDAQFRASAEREAVCLNSHRRFKQQHCWGSGWF